MSRPLFTTGTARGGTNLVAQMLSVNKQVYLSADPFIPLFRELRNAIVLRSSKPAVASAVRPQAPLDDYYYSSLKLDTMHTIQEANLDIPFQPERRQVFYEALAQRMSLSSANLIPYLHLLDGARYADVFESALRLIQTAAKVSDRQWVGFNENWAVEFFPLLARAFPDARFVIVLRDPRAAIASALRETEPTKIPHVISFAKHWRKYVAFILHYQASDMFRNRLKVLKYEDLVRDPDRHAKELTQFLGVDYNPAMLDTDNFRDASGGKWKGNSHFQPPGRGIYQSSVDAWREFLPVEIVEAIEFVCDPELRLFGYVPAVHVASPYPSAACLSFIAKDCRDCKGWRTDFGEPERDVGYELFRKTLLLGRNGSLDKEIVNRSFLFEEIFEALVDFLQSSEHKTGERANLSV